MVTVYIIGTPIGNARDISLRALDTLRSLDCIVCEDTRVTEKLLRKLGMEKSLVSFHAYSAGKRLQRILSLLREGKKIGVVTDAGMPGISDPGAWLISELRRRLGEAVLFIPIPGPTALTTALSISGFPADTFHFLGFPPARKRRAFFQDLARYSKTVVFYESPHRLMKTMEELSQYIAPDRQIVVA
ncbi:MAG: 16S rRNA (cytidine(1402)-2'-O)-methyltransferase, partial [Parcubacteria group bacterium]|nr:16S rRNA (cytidine(1402)-2'-O)-methyltransferase [Parcubacteria group bacterium]